MQQCSISSSESLVLLVRRVCTRVTVEVFSKVESITSLGVLAFARRCNSSWEGRCTSGPRVVHDNEC